MGSEQLDSHVKRSKKWTPDLAASERYDECLNEYVLEISGPSYKGKDISESTAKGYSSVVKMFLPTLSKASVEGLAHLADRGNIIEQKLEPSNPSRLSAATVKSYLYVLKAFLEWLRGQESWLAEIGISENQVGITAKAVQTIATGMAKKVNKEKVARAAEVPLTGRRLHLAMVGHYLESERHSRLRKLLDERTKAGEALTKEEYTLVRDNMMLLLTVRNVKRAGDVPHLLIRQVEAMEIPDKETDVEFLIAKHKTAGAGKPSPLKVSSGTGAVEAVCSSDQVESTSKRA